MLIRAGRGNGCFTSEVVHLQQSFWATEIELQRTIVLDE